MCGIELKALLWPPLRRDRRTERTAAKRRSASVYFLRRDLGALREAIRISPRSIIPKTSIKLSRAPGQIAQSMRGDTCVDEYCTTPC